MPTKAPTKKDRRDMHLHIDAEHDRKLTEIKNKLWKDQSRTGEPTDIGGVQHAIAVTHQLMFSK